MNSMFCRRAVAFLFVACILLVHISAYADTNATISGLVTDPQGRAVTDTTIILTNVNTGSAYQTKTNGEGIYRLNGLQPGIYRANVSKDGFKSIVKADIELHVQDQLSINFALQLGSVMETVTVEAGAPLINTQDASVSTVVDRKYVENMPLNGRSFQDLILLTPGVVTNTPQSTSGSLGQGGEFSVNGQRTESNVYLVDGVNANVGTNALGFAQFASTSGSLPGATALGTTQALVSVDALQEFRVESSTYSAEYGRNPGGQFSFVTRSGANQWHGTTFDYLRNDIFDANDWFNDYFGKPTSALRQNDFGGTLGGPIWRNKTFFFFSYEGLRLIQPQAAKLQNVPDTYLRTCAPAPLSQVLNAFPQPSASSPPPDCTNPDPGSGSAPFIRTWSNPSRIDSYSIRFDHAVNDKLKLFFRFADIPSSTTVRSKTSASVFTPTAFTMRTYTAGATSMLSPRIGNDFRMNYSSNESAQSDQLDKFGGAVPVDLLQLQGLSPGTNPSPAVNVDFIMGGFMFLSQDHFAGDQRQWNLVDTVSASRGRHQLKFGVDYRRLTPVQASASPSVVYIFFGASAVQANSANIADGRTSAVAYPLYTNFSAFIEDEWHMANRLTLSMGLRWEVNPAPASTKGKSNLPFTFQGNNLSTLMLAPQGTPLWQTSWYNFAPRLGAAYVLRDRPDRETVLRGGLGVFFDTGQQLGSVGYQSDGFSAVSQFAQVSFPLAPAQVSPAITNPPVAPYNQVFAFPAHLQLPFTLEWNASLQQALGKSQALTVSYVGANARRLLEFNEITPGPINPNFGTVVFLQNGLTADNNALQLQFQRRLSSGLTALASYTWSHSIDFGSQSAAFPSVRGNSDFDVRHNFSAAVSYDVPSHFRSGFARAVLGHWGLDDRFTARTGFPITLNGPQFIDPATGNTNNAGLDLVSGVPVYLYGANCASVLQGLGDLAPGLGCPSGRAINPNAFTPPPGCDEFACPGPAAGNAPRNFVRGFGAWQMDFAIRREFPIYERLKLQFRAEAFNVFNHPNFGFIDPDHSHPQFGQTTGTLAQTLGVLSPLYQAGGPRSMQFALKLVF
jgi:hypothetical protein